ncbi:MAG: SPOR domain-containing protein [Halanaerobacter sp.]
MRQKGVIKIKVTKRIIVLLIIGLFIINLSVQAEEEESLNINFSDLPLDEAFRNLAEMTDMNIAVDSSVEGTVTLYLHDVSVYDALDALTRTHGLDYKIIEETVYVAPKAEIKSDYGAMKTQIFKLENADPEQVKSNIEHLVKEGTIQINERTNSLIITTYQKELEKIVQTIEGLDYSRQQVSLQVRFEEVSHDKMRDLGIDWEVGSQGDVNTNSNSDAENFEIGELGFGYQASLNLLEEKGAASTIANPKITTMAGEEAQINIGDEIPVVKVETSEEDDGTTETTTEVDYRDIGIDLNILPKVREGSKILINLKPTVTTFLEWKEVGRNRYPKTSVKEVETKVEVKDGETIAIGGLIQETERENMSKVPFLSDMPILGKIFRKENVENEKRELVIFITPKIIDVDEEDQIEEEQESSQGDKEEVSSAQEESSKLLYASNLVPDKDIAQGYVLQLGAFKKEENAKGLLKDLKAKNFAPTIVQDELYKVRLGPFNSEKKLNEVDKKLKEYDFKFYSKSVSRSDSAN